METRTYYFPRNRVGRYVLNYLIHHFSCYIGSVRKVSDNLAVSITTQKNDLAKVERILQIYDLM